MRERKRGGERERFRGEQTEKLTESKQLIKKERKRVFLSEKLPLIYFF